jgi:hypothetical protein
MDPVADLTRRHPADHRFAPIGQQWNSDNADGRIIPALDNAAWGRGAILVATNGVNKKYAEHGRDCVFPARTLESHFGPDSREFLNAAGLSLKCV